MTNSRPELDNIIKQSIIKDGTPTRYCLKPRADPVHESEPYRKMTFGERNRQKLHKTILMVGETGTGKTTLINVMINYLLGVKREDKVWFEITDDQSDWTSAHSQTSIITVYGFYLQESPIHLTIIDTPGYGDTRGISLDQEITVSFLSLSELAKGIHEINAVCLVVKVTQNRLSDRKNYIFDAVQSLFGRGISENIVLLFTHSDGMHPTDALTAVEEAKIKCAINDQNQPVFFLFDNCQSDAADEKDEEEYEKEEQRLAQSWDLSFGRMTHLFRFLNTIRPKTLQINQNVLQKQKQLEAKIFNLQSHVQMMELKQNELKQTLEVLEKNKEYVKNEKNFEYEVDVPYKERVDIDSSQSRVAMCCTVCEENCHYPGCWWISGLSWCSLIKDDHCTVCTNKCHYSKHVKAAKIYEIKTKKEKASYENLKQKYEDTTGDGISVVKKLDGELKELEKERIKLVVEAFHRVETLEMIALNTESLSSSPHIDYLIEKLKEIDEHVKAETLENLKKRAGEGKQ